MFCRKLGVQLIVMEKSAKSIATCMVILVLLPGCPSPSCPAGTVQQEGRCLAGPDTGDADADTGIDCAESCAEATPVCDRSMGACVACTEDVHCGDELSVCDPDTKSCVACTEDAHCVGELSACDPDTRTCVGCTRSSQCGADAPVCDPELRSCSACRTSDDCAAFADTPVCGERGECVECTQETAVARCDGYTCSALTNTCTSVAPYALLLCEACSSDLQCAANARCANVSFFGGSEQVCVPDATKVTCNTSSTRPYVRTHETTSVAGEAVSVCASYLSSCEAVRAYTSGRPCANHLDCGLAGACRQTGPLAGFCTLHCPGPYGCRAVHTCEGGFCQ